MFNVLVIAYYYPPMGLSGVQRTLKFTKYLPKYGWQPTVLTTGKTGYFAHDLALLKEAEEAGVKIERTDAFDINSILKNYGTISIPSEWIRKLFNRISKTLFIPDNKISWSKQAYKRAKELVKNNHFDVIFVSIPPYSSFVYAAKLSEETGIPLIVDYRDLWLNNQFSFYPTHYHKVRHKKLEYASLKKSDHIIAVNRRVKESLLNAYKFLKFEDITIIPHGFDPQDFAKAVSEKREGLRKKLKIIYSGLFYERITPEHFLKAFKKLTKVHPDVAENIELHFTGIFRKENKKLIRKMNLHKFVFIHGYLEHPQAINKLLSADVLWVMLPNTAGMENVSSGKLFEYFGTGKPIIASIPQGSSQVAATEYGASYITRPDDVDDIFNTLIKVHSDFQLNKLPKSNNEFVTQHDRELLTKQLALKFQFTMRDEI